MVVLQVIRWGGLHENVLIVIYQILEIIGLTELLKISLSMLNMTLQDNRDTPSSKSSPYQNKRHTDLQIPTPLPNCVVSLQRPAIVLKKLIIAIQAYGLQSQAVESLEIA